jgi:hypothetical protein
MTVETARNETPPDVETKIPDEAVNVLEQATRALKTLARRQSDRRIPN